MKHAAGYIFLTVGPGSSRTDRSFPRPRAFRRDGPWFSLRQHLCQHHQLNRWSPVFRHTEQ